MIFLGESDKKTAWILLFLVCLVNVNVAYSQTDNRGVKVRIKEQENDKEREELKEGEVLNDWAEAKWKSQVIRLIRK